MEPRPQTLRGPLCLVQMFTHWAQGPRARGSSHSCPVRVTHEKTRASSQTAIELGKKWKSQAGSYPFHSKGPSWLSLVVPPNKLALLCPDRFEIRLGRPKCPLKTRLNQGKTRLMLAGIKPAWLYPKSIWVGQHAGENQDCSLICLYVWLFGDQGLCPMLGSTPWAKIAFGLTEYTSTTSPKVSNMAQ